MIPAYFHVPGLGDAKGMAPQLALNQCYHIDKLTNLLHLPYNHRVYCFVIEM